MNKVMCFLTGGHKFKSPAESKCNDKEKTCTIRKLAVNAENSFHLQVHTNSLIFQM